MNIDVLMPIYDDRVRLLIEDGFSYNSKSVNLAEGVLCRLSDGVQDYTYKIVEIVSTKL